MHPHDESSEFSLIRRYFTGADAGPGVVLGVGDDAALLRVPEGRQLVVSTDTLVAGRHFPLDTAPRDIGHKALAVNLSDLAAMGAEPLACLLALTVPKAHSTWLEAFSDGFKALARRERCPLVGGDTTRGPLAIGVTVLGHLPAGRALTRAGAKVGDAVAVTGTLGDAALALWLLQEDRFDPANADHAWLRRRLDAPEPRLAAGRRLREAGLAHAALDLSDGLAGDLRHILAASGVSATLDTHRLPASPVFTRVADACGVSGSAREALMLSGGDDYELCACLPAERVEAARAALAGLDHGWTMVGEIVALEADADGEPTLALWDAGAGVPRAYEGRGYSHFTVAANDGDAP